MDDSAELLDSKAELDQEEMERLLRSNRALKGRLDELERENRLLKQRNFDLSMRYGRSAENRQKPFELVFSDSDGGDGCVDNSSNNASDNNDVSGAGYSVEESESGTEFAGEVGLQSMAVEGAVNAKDLANGRDSVSFKDSVNVRDTVSSKDSGNANDLVSSKDLGNAKDTINSKATVTAKDKASAKDKANAKDPAEDMAAAATIAEPPGKDKPRDRQRRLADSWDGDRDGSARLADVDSAPAKERKGVAEASAGSGSRRREAKQLKCYAELDGHEGAIYAAQYSPLGGLVASASFDKTVRIWDIREQKALAVLEGHAQSVFDVAWRQDAAAVVSAAFDRTCIEWDVEARAASNRLACDGLVQCARYSTHNPRVVYSGDSSGFITIHDTRQPARDATRLSNDGNMVNTIFCFGDETRLMSGDRNGEIKMWDVRIGRFMRLISADGQPHQAISHISVVKNDKSGTEYMAVNSYDNVLRVYDRVDDSSVPTPRVIHELRGIRSRNWPIKNAFLDPRVAQEQLLGLYDDDYYELDMRSQSEARGLRSMLFLITGSAEPFAYLYKLNTHSKTVRMDDKARRGTRQRLEGHSDRVYAVATHPTEIKACTAGADNTIRLWHIPSAGRLLKEGY
ncbi:hypothetical protein IWW50_004066 [Coemansia erecta]|nr:hypothetical protein GGF43_002360 [Coemansia sp. RSA 2618]KAJ2822780.1 hypothetical protein IWW50_004066 [Coemansia erecta]